MAVRTLSSGTKQVLYMPMTIQAIPCPPPILQSDFDGCRIPGGIELWSNGGFYSPGECFEGYRAMCTQTSPVSNGWPIRNEETVVRCVPDGYDCNDMTKDQKYAVTNYDGTTLSAPAFEIRWRSADLAHAIRTTEMNPPGIPTPFPTSTRDLPTSKLITTTTDTFVSAPTSAFPTSSTAVQLSSSSVSSSPPPQSNSALSPGTIAGITVGSCLGFLIVVSASAFLFLHRRRKHKGQHRLTEDTWCQQGAHKEPSELLGTQCPAELEDKPMELRELPVEPQLCAEAEQVTHASRASHISVNAIPVEVAAYPSQKTSQEAE
ncbi:uncharacterized protein TRIVIDRAFT_69279 [Trichoderma virens Gv29-8]|uniref:Uncharacterized protein n=1 Tax=Hypocrea virens (strain Gv29-8 / FGSC 10586) TaxID=413071 RepID=G9N2H2_HYPVG|nr:uncharacterized protein TRIVIDRAFT_69279 [Trichoderma virens Gv29-8]EHK19283.1 hypothetical protein TRIVIDRAFT_69279 [Trichoderma virens Gv29-8]UKZ49264.1 hypothetical protein TrVGV298_003509 [Trichoderma virens]